MIKAVLDILAVDEFYGISERVEVAKGKYKIAYSFKEAFKKIKRLWLIRKLK